MTHPKPLNLIQPIQLGNRLFHSNLIQAPLAGISCAPYRQLIAQFGGAAYCVTEMISAKTLLHRPHPRYTYKSQKEGALCFQLSGNNAAELQAAAMQVEAYGADLIDLNCGCPVDKIRKKNCGSKLLSMSRTLEEIIKAIKEKVALPLSIKIRVDGVSGDNFNTDIVKAITDAGADFIIVHGRHWSEHYETPVRLDEIAAIVHKASIPVIGNGDVKDYPSLKKMFEATKCQGVMLGRASVGRPWLFQMLGAEDRGEPYQPPTPAQIGALFLEHIRHLMEIEAEHIAVLQARTLSKYYLRAADLNPLLQAEFNTINDFKKLTKLTHSLFYAE